MLRPFTASGYLRKVKIAILEENKPKAGQRRQNSSPAGNADLGSICRCHEAEYSRG